MFDILVADPARLPAKFHNRVAVDGAARAAADYLAGMTDRFALDEHGRLTSAIR
jgi:dGTPase